jgi:2-polyprenyl-3-methyl-5-hydroxy-6-metoxy-1,4-benzoquinol methylase
MRDRYSDGAYLRQNPSWHIEDSGWKALQIVKMLQKHQFRVSTVCEVGCGAGEILKELHDSLDDTIRYVGYEISPQAHEISKSRQTDRLRFELKDVLAEHDIRFDLMLVMDVIEHVENQFEFLRSLKPKSEFTILHIPLDLSAQAVLRGTPLLRARETVGHVHYFTKDLALRLLKETGYEVIDNWYTCGSLDLPNRSLATAVARIPRRLALATGSDWAVRTLGGFSLLVLAR